MKASRPPATVESEVRRVAAKLRRAKLAFAHGTTDPVAEAAFLVGEAVGLAPDDVATRPRARVTLAQRKTIDDLVARRIETRKPAAYLVGRIYMLGVPFVVDERAIVPRSYLGEVLADDILDTLLPDPSKVRRVLDLCTGSGCLAVLAAMRFPNARVDAVDLSADALALAKENVALHRLGRRIRLLRGDLYGPVAGKRYDLILSNPPYVDAEGMAGLPPECRHEPAMAFDGGDDGIALVRRIVDGASRHLNDGGGLLCEVGRCRPALERAHPRTPFLWLDTEDSIAETFWLDGASLP